ncbi:hypothetical protein ACTXT7_003526 [Hymenolepis weldensis]
MVLGRFFKYFEVDVQKSQKLFPIHPDLISIARSNLQRLVAVVDPKSDPISQQYETSKLSASMNLSDKGCKKNTYPTNLDIREFSYYFLSVSRIYFNRKSFILLRQSIPNPITGKIPRSFDLMTAESVDITVSPSVIN